MGRFNSFFKSSKKSASDAVLQRILYDVREILIPRLKREFLLQKANLSNIDSLLATSQLSIALSRMGFFEDARSLAFNALKTARDMCTISYDDDRLDDAPLEWVGQFVCVAFAKVGDLQTAYTIAKEFSSQNVNQIQSLFKGLVELNDFELALRVIEENQEGQNAAFFSICERLIEIGNIDYALTLAENTTDELSLFILCNTLFDAGYGDKALKVAQRAKNLKLKIGGAIDAYLMILADCLSSTGQINEAKELYQDMLKSADTTDVPLILARKARMLASIGEFEEALAIAYALKKRKMEALTWIAEMFARKRRVKDALDCVCRIDDEDCYFDSLVSICKHLSDIRHIPLVLDKVNNIKDKDRRSDALFYVCKALILQDQFVKALNQFKPLLSSYHRDKIVDFFLERSVQTGQINAAINYVEKNSENLIEVVERLGEIYYLVNEIHH